MAQAAAAAWQHLQQAWPQARQLLVACGSGNNGGDGWTMAGLALQAGWPVQVITADNTPPGTPLAQAARVHYLQAGGQALAYAGALPGCDLIVDALLGLGLSRPPQAAMAGLIEAINAAGVPVLSLDVPSGVDAGSGAVAGPAVVATQTLQFIHAHTGLYTGPALEHVGQALLAPLTVPAEATAGIAAQAEVLHADALAALLPPRRRNAHKGDNGHVLCLGGNHGMGGAVVLAAQAALRSGAGLVSVATRPAHVAAALTRCPELMARGCESSDELQPLFDRAGVVAVGPGLGSDDWAQALYAQALGWAGPRVLDADALNLLARAPQPLPGAVLTPHPGEAARLLGCMTADVQSDRFGALAALVERFACTVVLKGAGSLVGSPGQRPVVIAAGNPGMAVGGMGDVLTGVIAALLAQALAPFAAACGGALLHAAAGDAAAGNRPRGLLPTDLLPHLRVLANPET